MIVGDGGLGLDNPSSDYLAQIDYWNMIEAINSGAKGMRENCRLYLPQFPNESYADYAYRCKFPPFTNIYSDISRNLAAKPFSKELKLEDDSDPELEGLCEDIDGQGNNLHVFGSAVFRAALDKAIDWILVDYSKAPAGNRPRSKAEEQAAGLRPYWVHVPAERMLAVYSATIGGVEQFVHARIREDVVERKNWKEVTKERIRVFNRDRLNDGNYAEATFQIWERQRSETGVDKWVSIEGPSPVSIGIIPLVPFITGIRQGATWQIRPPLRDIAHLQIEEYQQESNLKSILELTCFPMLVGVGVKSTDDKGNAIKVPVGPRSVLFGPQGSEWKYLEVKADSIKALEAHLDETRKNMLALGMQPMMQANLTVITSAHISVKANSAAQAWALGLKDALEQAFKITAMWLGKQAKAPEVNVFTDFGVELGDDKDIENILKAEFQGLLDEETALSEMQRRAFISENLDLEEVLARVKARKKEMAVIPAKSTNSATGEPVIPPSNRAQATKVVQ